MPTKRKRVTFMLTDDVEKWMDEAKRIFFDRTQSEIIRLLFAAGMAAVQEEKSFVPETADGPCGNGQKVAWNNAVREEGTNV